MQSRIVAQLKTPRKKQKRRESEKMQKKA